MALNRCVRDPGECPLSRVCAVHEVWKQAQTEIRTLLRGFTIACLARRQRQIRKEIITQLESQQMSLPGNQVDSL